MSWWSWLVAVLSIVAVVYVVKRILRSFYLPFAGKTVFITGCDSGFGYLLAQRLDQLGVSVVAGCLTPSGAEAVKQGRSSSFQVALLDVTSQSDIDAVARNIAVNSPNGLWGVVNNAGISGSLMEIDLMDVSDFQKVMDVNYMGTVRTTKACYPLLKESRGRVINIASVAGIVSAPAFSSYSASKFAVEAFSDALRLEGAHFGVSVSIIEPGFMRTPIVTESGELLRKFWAKMTPEQKKEYGEEWFKAKLEFQAKVAEKSEDPQMVVDAIVHALFARFPQIRYRLGRHALPAVIAAHLPSGLGDFFKRFPIRHINPAASIRFGGGNRANGEQSRRDNKRD